MKGLPTSMRAVIATGAGDLAVVERPVPMCGRGEVLVKVAAAGVNRPDVLQSRGLYPPPPGAPDILGLEIAGEVVGAGEGAEGLVGQQVCALVAGGGYAEYCAAPAGTCLPVPEVITAVEAAAMPETLFTVWVNLFERGFASDGEWVLVHGGTSGIGTMAIALGRLFGLKLIVTCGSDSKCSRALELGAEAAINYRTQDFVEEAKKWTNKRGVDVVIEHIGGETFERSSYALTRLGTLVSIGSHDTHWGRLDLRHVYSKNLRIIGTNLGSILELRTLLEYVVDGRLKPVIDRAFPLAEARAAVQHVLDRKNKGKVLLVPQ